MDLIIFEDCEAERAALVQLIGEFNKNQFTGNEKINILLASGEYQEIINFASLLECPTAFMLDIEANGENIGFAIADEIKRLNPYHAILYVTKEQEEITYNYDRKHGSIGFVIKRLDKSFIEEIYFYINKSMESLSGSRYFTFENRQIGFCKVFFKDIIMFEKVKNRDSVYIYYFISETVALSSFTSKSLISLLERLDGGFIQCHKSYIVNKDMIIKKEKNYLYLKGDINCPYISKRIKGI